MEGAVNPLGLDDRLAWDIMARQVPRGRLSEVCAPRSAASACCGPGAASLAGGAAFCLRQRAALPRCASRE